LTQVAGELDPLVTQSEHTRERLRENGFAQSGEVFDQQMAAGQQAGEGE
jgi:hypothetical protein